MLKKIYLIAAITFLSIPIASYAGIIEVEESGIFINGQDIGSSAYDIQLNDPASTLDGFGFSSSFENNLNDHNLGTLTWSITNNTGSSINGLEVFGYWNADIDFATNTFHNEHAEYVGNTGASSYEIDEPGYVFGDIYDNLLDGELDNMNSVDASHPEDVSFALGFFLGDIAIGESFLVTLEVSESDIGGIQHFDPDSDYSYFFNMSAEVITTASVSEPSSLSLILAGMFSLLFIRRKISH